MNAAETYEIELLRAEVHQELKAIRRLENELRAKINAIDAASSVFLLRRVAQLEAEVNAFRRMDGLEEAFEAGRARRRG